MKYVVEDIPPIPKEIKDPNTLAYFIIKTFDLVPKKGKGDVVIHTLLLFLRVSHIKEGVINVDGVDIEVKDGALKVKDILRFLHNKNIFISHTQFYSTYLERFIERGLIIKKSGSRYGLRAKSLQLTVEEIRRNIESLLEKVADHAVRLDEAIEGKL